MFNRLKKFVSILLLHAILLQLCNKVGVFTWFKINQKEIVELFCINKNKPQIECDGKCYLKNKLQETEQSTTNNQTAKNNQVKQVNEELFFIETNSNKFILNLKKHYFLEKDNYYKLSLITSIFHPPPFKI